VQATNDAKTTGDTPAVTAVSPAKHDGAGAGDESYRDDFEKPADDDKSKAKPTVNPAAANAGVTGNEQIARPTTATGQG